MQIASTILLSSQGYSRKSAVPSSSQLEKSRRKGQLREAFVPTWQQLFTTVDLHELCLGLAGFLESSDGRAGDTVREDDESAQKGPLRSYKSLSPDGLTLRRPWLVQVPNVASSFYFLVT